MSELITSFAIKSQKGVAKPLMGSEEHTRHVTSIVDKNLHFLIQKFKNSYTKKSILLTLQNSLQSSWYDHTSADYKLQSSKQLNTFFTWLSDQKRLAVNLLSKYEQSLLSSNSLRPQSLPTPLIKRFLKRGLKDSTLSSHEYQFVYLVVKSYTTPKAGKKNPQKTLTSWFGKHQWLRDLIPEHFGKLESPKILVPSFQLTIACVLEVIMDAREELIKVLEDNQLCMEELVGNSNERKAMSYRDSLKCWVPLVKKAFIINSNSEPKTPLSLLLASDLFSSVQYTNTMNIIMHKGLKQLEFEPYMEEFKARKQLFSSPYILCHEFDKEIDNFSKQLFAWIMATLMIQPGSIKKLTLKNYLELKNKSGRTKSIQFKYYKPRSNKIYETPIVNTKNYYGKIIVRYMELVTRTDESSFTADRSTNRVSTLDDGIKNDNLCTIFLKIIRSSIFKKRFFAIAKKENISSIFYTAFTALVDKNISRRRWVTDNPDKTNADYTKEHLKPLTLTLFTNTHLKNSGVHSRSDLYRYEDLLNQNSHTSHVESIYYLSDDNKDWVNQSGRIQRLVTNDIIDNHFSIDYKTIQFKVDERNSLTQFLTENDSLEGSINEIGVYVPKDSNPDIVHTLIVIDTPETAVIMMHYIQQVKDKYHLLLENRPDYLINHVIIILEWMQYCLSNFSPKTLKDAEQRFKSIYSVLPELFTDNIQTGGLNA